MKIQSRNVANATCLAKQKPNKQATNVACLANLKTYVVVLPIVALISVIIIPLTLLFYLSIYGVYFLITFIGKVKKVIHC